MQKLTLSEKELISQFASGDGFPSYRQTNSTLSPSFTEIYVLFVSTVGIAERKNL